MHSTSRSGRAAITGVETGFSIEQCSGFEYEAELFPSAIN